MDPVPAGGDPAKLSTRNISYRGRPDDADGKVMWLRGMVGCHVGEDQERDSDQNTDTSGNELAIVGKQAGLPCRCVRVLAHEPMRPMDM